MIAPTTWLVICTTTAENRAEVSSADPAIGFFCKANRLVNLSLSGNFKPMRSLSHKKLSKELSHNNIDGILIIFFMVIVVVMIGFTLQACLKALKSDKPTANEAPYAPMPANAEAIISGTAH